MLSIKTFQIDITPELSAPICGHGPGAEAIETPIYARGIILDSNQEIYVLCVIENCLITGSYHLEISSLLSGLCQAKRKNISVHTSHQHDVPSYDDIGHTTSDHFGLTKQKYHWNQFLEKIKKNLPQQINQQSREISFVSTNHSTINEFASDRRIIHDGKLYWRATKCQDPFLKSLPEGEFDPDLCQMSFYDTDKNLLATLNFYASHPQVANGRQLISSDAPGFALKKMNENFPEAFHMYFAGCGGDIGNGKWANQDIAADIEIFGNKLFIAMQDCLQQATLAPCDHLRWENHIFPMPLRKFTENCEELEEIITGKKPFQGALHKVARLYGFLKKNIQEYPFRITQVQIAKKNIFLFPAEMFCSYQKYIKNKLQDPATCVAAYGDGFFAYVPQDHDFDLGGFEIHGSFRVLEKGCEKKILNEIDFMLKN